MLAELNDAALYGSQRQVLGHAVKRISHWVRSAAKRRFHAET
ncbi:hypothetical protein LEP1GSC171_2220 [Leptospira santarosai str. HAI1380]|nr:hypothetical protein LEP1GSC171_2220 [Leptospira santarosai str. HAI1380]